jgi:hypothetical protein
MAKTKKDKLSRKDKVAQHNATIAQQLRDFYNVDVTEEEIAELDSSILMQPIRIPKEETGIYAFLYNEYFHTMEGERSKNIRTLMNAGLGVSGRREETNIDYTASLIAEKAAAMVIQILQNSSGIALPQETSYMAYHNGLPEQVIDAPVDGWIDEYGS